MGPEDFAAFTGAIVHELGTPLAVIAGEVDLALARDRSPAAYREALSRIAERVAEMIDLTCDCALFGSARDLPVVSGQTANLREVFEALATRYGARRGHSLTLTGGASTPIVAGDVKFITGALALIVEHGARHRRSGSQLHLRALPAEQPGDRPDTIDLVLEATPGGFSPSAWQALAPAPAAPGPSHGELRLETAARIIHACTGSLQLIANGDMDAVLIRLRRGAADARDTDR